MSKLPLYVYLAGSILFAAGSALSLAGLPTGRLNLWLYLAGSIAFVIGSALSIARS